MKQTLIFTALGLVAAGAGAQEIGRVVSSTPVIQQVAVPRTYCNQPQYTPPPPTSGAGGLMGAVAGGAIGSTIGHGSGTAAAVLIGTIGGAILGNNVEASGQRGQATQTCATETSYENRTVGYNVTYEYAGREFTTQLPYDPGPTIQLQVTPMASNVPTGPIGMPAPGTGAVVTAPPVAVQATQPVVTAQQPQVVVVQPQPQVVYQSYPAYPAYPVYAPYYRPYFPIGISLGYTYHRHGGRWR